MQNYSFFRHSRKANVAEIVTALAGILTALGYVTPDQLLAFVGIIGAVLMVTVAVEDAAEKLGVNGELRAILDGVQELLGQVEDGLTQHPPEESD